MNPSRLAWGFVTAAAGYFAARLAAEVLGLDAIVDDLGAAVLDVAPWLRYGGEAA